MISLLRFGFKRGLAALIAVVLIMYLVAGGKLSLPTPRAESWSGQIVGQATVIDGDTLRIGSTKVRLFGVDTPESCQKGFKEAADMLVRLVQPGAVSCTPTGSTTYGRIVARCEAGGVDLSERLVFLGYAVDWPKYSGGAYADEQREAVKFQRALWKHQSPWDPAQSHHVCR